MTRGSAMSTQQLGDLLWQPDDQTIREAKLTAFIAFVSDSRGVDVETYDDLWAWSVECLEDFWAALWDYFEVGDRSSGDVVLLERKMPGAKWFPEAQVNFAQFILSRGAGESPVIISR